MDRPRLAALAAACALLWPLGASADLRVDQIEAKSIKLDGVPKEWTTLVSLGTTLKGSPKKADLEARGRDRVRPTSSSRPTSLTTVLSGGDTSRSSPFPGRQHRRDRPIPAIRQVAGSAKAKDGSLLGRRSRRRGRADGARGDDP
jgi:hypothetical protein